MTVLLQIIGAIALLCGISILIVREKTWMSIAQRGLAYFIGLSLICLSLPLIGRVQLPVMKIFVMVSMPVIAAVSLIAVLHDYHDYQRVIRYEVRAEEARSTGHEEPLPIDYYTETARLIRERLRLKEFTQDKISGEDIRENKDKTDKSN